MVHQFVRLSARHGTVIVVLPFGVEMIIVITIPSHVLDILSELMHLLFGGVGIAARSPYAWTAVGTAIMCAAFNIACEPHGRWFGRRKSRHRRA